MKKQCPRCKKALEIQDKKTVYIEYCWHCGYMKQEDKREAVK